MKVVLCATDMHTFIGKSSCMEYPLTFTRGRS